jgi:hypothetical protein
MMDKLNLIMLVCASVGSLALGVLTAYAVLRGAFALMRPQPRMLVKPQAQAARVL